MFSQIAFLKFESIIKLVKACREHFWFFTKMEVFVEDGEKERQHQHRKGMERFFPSFILFYFIFLFLF
jgi:hypothetical protein